MDVEIRVLGPADPEVLSLVAPGVFDNEIDGRLAVEFLQDPRHHLVVALDDGEVVGFASAVHYIHPDKPPELWINEVGVAQYHQRRGLGKRLLQTLFEVGRSLDCREAWVLTDQSNEPALRLYKAAGGEPTDQVMFSFQLSE